MMRLTPRDAWVIRTLLTGGEPDGEVEDASEPVRRLARLMGPLPPVERARLWEASRALHDDPDGLIRTVAAADPDGPAPGPEEEVEDWPPLRLGDPPAVEPFPDDVFPEGVADYIAAVAKAIGCPPDYVGLPCLVVAAGAIGRSVAVELKPGYDVVPSLYGMNVGGPTTGKSPSFKEAVRPAWKIDRDLHAAYTETAKKYGEEMDAYEKAAAAAKPPRPTKPALRSLVLDDTTVEANAAHLARNPRGLLIARDELTAWMAAMNQYRQGKGSDRQFYLSALHGTTVRVDRKGDHDRPIRVPQPCLSIVGNIPPSMLGELREQKGRADGFIERMLYAFPDAVKRPHWDETGIHPEAAKTWAEVVRKLHGREPDVGEDGDLRPRVVPLADAARPRWKKFYDAHADEVNEPGYDPADLAVEGKLVDFAARFALILYLMDLAADPEAGDPDAIPLRHVEGAIKLWKYFRSHARRVRWYMARGVGNPAAAAIVAWLRAGGRRSFSERDIKQARPRLDPRELAAALDHLAQVNAIRRRDPAPPKPQGGRPATATYDVHPDLLPVPQNLQNLQNPGPGGPPA
jgi:hypothetical protein